MLAQHSDRRVTSTNLGKGGLTTTSMAAQLTDPTVRKALAGADVVVVTIGANDLIPLIGQWHLGKCASACISTATTAMQARLQTVLASLNTEVQPGAKVLVTNYWNVFEDGDVADRDYGAGFAAWSDAVTKSANVAISAAAAANAEQDVDIYEPFEGNGDRNPTSLLAADGDHPNAAGHRLIAEALIQASPTLGVPS
jgi:lysophospholipase L1-like esterase